MKREMKRAITDILLFLIIVGGFVITHEETHKTIFHEYGIDSSINCGPAAWKKGAICETAANVTQFNELCNKSQEACISLVQSQTQVENLGYQMEYIFAVIIMSIIVIIGRIDSMRCMRNERS